MKNERIVAVALDVKKRTPDTRLGINPQAVAESKSELEAIVKKYHNRQISDEPVKVQVVHANQFVTIVKPEQTEPLADFPLSEKHRQDMEAIRNFVSSSNDIGLYLLSDFVHTEDREEGLFSNALTVEAVANFVNDLRINPTKICLVSCNTVKPEEKAIPDFLEHLDIDPPITVAAYYFATSVNTEELSPEEPGIGKKLYKPNEEEITKEQFTRHQRNVYKQFFKKADDGTWNAATVYDYTDKDIQPPVEPEWAISRRNIAQILGKEEDAFKIRKPREGTTFTGRVVYNDSRYTYIEHPRIPRKKEQLIVKVKRGNDPVIDAATSGQQIQIQKAGGQITATLAPTVTVSLPRGPNEHDDDYIRDLLNTHNYDLRQVTERPGRHYSERQPLFVDAENGNAYFMVSGSSQKPSLIWVSRDQQGDEPIMADKKYMINVSRSGQLQIVASVIKNSRGAAL